MTFKIDWENIDSSRKLEDSLVLDMVNIACPNEAVLEHKSVSSGCANINIKLDFKDTNKPKLLRVYLRDKEAALREQKLKQLIFESVPIPSINYIGELGGHTFALCDFLPGITLRQYLLNEPKPEIENIMRQVGQSLADIDKQNFPKAGFFDKELNIKETITQDSYIQFANQLLQDKTVYSALDDSVLNRIKVIIEKFSSYFPNEKPSVLVHGDFGPENILVDHIDGKMQVSGILDWEYAFAGSSLHDVANMLRYAHQMPPEFKDAFIDGMQSSGVTLPDGWEISIKLLNLSSLLDCLKCTNLETQPKRYADILELVNFNLAALNGFEK